MFLFITETKDVQEWGEWNIHLWDEGFALLKYESGKLILQVNELHNEVGFFNLQLDIDRWHEALPGWIPVKTDFGNGVLIFENYD